ncbi:hypothetical protein A0H81_14784 [Grifola frondosa]|uniref:Uncharacterized protein n=1 Tax=Grifola frondosa TaxID=5627 RepID=A0A1C7LRB1_GRIFR|nr:hypothetical protein A0H81_14784 [Grifola frondosa]
MSRPFVVARFLANQSARWTSWYGVQASEHFLPTRPFLALPVVLKDFALFHNPSSEDRPFLFVVSPCKPTGVFRGTCLPLALPSEVEGIDLVVEPPLPLSFGRPLYLHTAPFLQDNKFDLRAAVILLMFSTGLMKIVFANSPGVSSGEEPVEAGWDSWSGYSDRENLHDPTTFAFQRVPFAELTLPLEHPTIYTELRLYRQLANDFSWVGVTPTIAWVKHITENANKQKFFDVPVVRKESLALFELPRLSGGLIETARTLHSMRIPYDGDPPPKTDVVDDEFAWDDEPTPTFGSPPKVQPAIALGDMKIIVFDLYGTIFDRERVIRDVLESLATPKVHRLTSDDLYKLYITYESHRSREQSSTTGLIRGALNDVADHLDLSINNEAMATALKQILQAPLYADVLSAVEALHNHGVRLFDCSHYILPGIQADQVLLVTTARYRVLEPATAAHIPTALLHRRSCMEASVEWDDGQTAAINVDDLKSLCETVVLAQ